NIHVPFVVGAVAVVLGIVALSTGHRQLSAADGQMAAGDESVEPTEEEIAGEVADEFGGAPGAIDDELHHEHARHRTHPAS
ncbi:hypothetical protein FHX82_006736, partial [Amycolatopsis bartoniae]|nr:hypothetical protein [Amycolatopsis bartoniae]